MEDSTIAGLSNIDLLPAALRLATRGWHVFPVRVAVNALGHKQMSPGVLWRQASTTDPAMIEAWFGQGGLYRDASVAVDVGKSGLVVVDPDGAAGIAAWERVRCDAGTRDGGLSTWRVATPGGGEHWYYREAPGTVIGNDQDGAIAPGVDVRGLGGFVIAPPSTDARGVYRWLEGEPETTDALPVVPSIVIERMRAKRGRVDIGGQQQTLADDAGRPPDPFGAPARVFTLEQASAFVGRELTAFREMRTPEDSGFNGALNQLAVLYWHFIPEFVSHEQAVGTMLEAAEHNRSVEYQGYDGVMATIASGLRGPSSDRWKASRPSAAVAGGVVGSPDGGSKRVDGEGVDAAGHSWTPVDMGAVACGNYERPQCEIGERSDGVALLYPGREHVIASEPESGKTWFILHIVRSVLAAGQRVVYVDFEDDEGGIGSRLLELGVAPEVLTDVGRFVYVKPDAAPPAGAVAALLDDPRNALLVLDGTTEGYGLFGWEIEDNNASPRWRQVFVRPALNRGIATLASDHVVKSRDGRNGYAIGAQHKKAGLNGVLFELSNIRPFGLGMLGSSRVLIQKDRPGDLRRHGTLVPGSRATYLADLTLDATATLEGIELTLTAPADTVDTARTSTDTAEETLMQSRLDLIGVMRDVFPAHGATKAEARRHMVKPKWIHSVKTFDRSWDDLIERGRLIRIKGGSRYIVPPADEMIELDPFAHLNQ